MPVKIDLSVEPVEVVKDGLPLEDGVNYSVDTEENYVKVQGTEFYIGNVVHIFDPERVEPDAEVIVMHRKTELKKDVDYTLIEKGDKVFLYGKGRFRGAKEIVSPVLVMFRISFAVTFEGGVSVEGHGHPPLHPFKIWEGGAEIPLDGTNSVTRKPGTYIFTVAADGYASAECAVELVNEDETVNVQLALLRYQVTFNVIDDETSQPIDGYVLTIDGNPGSSPLQLINGTYACEVSKEGYIPTSFSFTVNGQNMVFDVRMNPVVHEMYWGNNPFVDGYGGWEGALEDMKDGGEAWVWYETNLPIYNDRITTDGKEIEFTGTGYPFIIVPKSLETLKRIDNAGGVDIIGAFTINDLVIDGVNYYIYMYSTSTSPVFTLTIRY